QMVVLNTTIVIRFHPNQNLVYVVAITDKTKNVVIQTPQPVREMFKIHENLFMIQLTNNSIMVINVEDPDILCSEQSQLYKFQFEIISTVYYSIGVDNILCASLNNGALIFMELDDKHIKVSFPLIEHPELIPPLKYLTMGITYIGGISGKKDIYFFLRDDEVDHFRMVIIDGPYETMKCNDSYIFAGNASGTVSTYRHKLVQNPFTNESTLVLVNSRVDQIHNDSVVNIINNKYKTSYSIRITINCE
ncbi:hypothetical protein SNEBB_008341, partial [Seison nebaliae]